MRRFLQGNAVFSRRNAQNYVRRSAARVASLIREAARRRLTKLISEFPALKAYYDFLKLFLEVLEKDPLKHGSK